jgi:hypothetical protein
MEKWTLYENIINILYLFLSLDAPFSYKWMHMVPYSEDDISISMKRRSSGGPELFAAAQSKSSMPLKNSMLFEQIGSCSIASASQSSGIYWPGRRRGSLPVEVCIAASGSCSSESESSGLI